MTKVVAQEGIHPDSLGSAVLAKRPAALLHLDAVMPPPIPLGLANSQEAYGLAIRFHPVVKLGHDGLLESVAAHRVVEPMDAGPQGLAGLGVVQTICQQLEGPE